MPMAQSRLPWPILSLAIIVFWLCPSYSLLLPLKTPYYFCTTHIGMTFAILDSHFTEYTWYDQLANNAFDSLSLRISQHYHAN